MNHLGTMYATKRRRRNSKSIRVHPREGQTKSNPSKRHRERLNSELDMLASLLPYDQSVLSKLDKLSILRLSVSYLRTKSYFQAILGKDREASRISGCINEIEGDLILQALNGFLLILTCDGEVFYTSHTVETYLGFHQSDICHQSVYELVHSEDREELQRHLMWNSHLPSDRTNCSIGEGLAPENWSFLERNFTVRFRCLLDNTSGFLRLDIRGRVKVLHGQNHKSEEPPLALFAVCTPFGPPSLLEMPQKDSMFKSKHKLDFAIVSMDPRGKQLLGYSDQEFAARSAYDLVHYDDLAYVASAHQELLKTGASGLIAYRLLIKSSNKWQWLQTSARLQYKNSKPEHIICTHRPLMEEEGRDLLGKRTMDFKVTYLDAGLTNLTSSSSSSNSNNANANSTSGGGGNNVSSSSNPNNHSSERSNSGSTSSMMSDSDFVMRCQRNRKYKSQIKEIVNNNNNNNNISPGNLTNGSTGSGSSRSSSKRKASSSLDLIDPASISPYATTNGSAGGGSSAAPCYEPSSIYHQTGNSVYNSMYNAHHAHHHASVYSPYNHHHVSPSDSTTNGLSSYCAAAASLSSTTAAASNFLSHLFPPPPPAAATTGVSSVTNTSSLKGHHHDSYHKDHHRSSSGSGVDLFPTSSLKSVTTDSAAGMNGLAAAAVIAADHSAAASARAASAAFLAAPEFLHSLQPYSRHALSSYYPDHHHSSASAAYHAAATAAHHASVAAAAHQHVHHHSLHPAAHHHHPHHAQYAVNGLFESASY